ncbi:glycosyltransferase [Bacillus massiliigorillae]|uniref:glycosyltransferase n=1 Tax=Bacillus massiliigorillae TaxID=1243664 RepID=UPI0005A6CDB0|nr:glycosyltransferase [Bacillus massiliigorillae]
MKLLFVHGGEKVKEDKELQLYTDGSYNQEVWNRYLSIFRNVTLVARKDSMLYEADFAKSNFQFFDKNKMNFIQIPNLTSSNQSFFSLAIRKKHNSIIEQAIKEHDFLIARLPSGAGYKAIEYAKKYNKPYLTEVVSCPWDSLWNYNLKGKIIAPFSYFSMKKFVESSPYVMYVTNEFLQSRYPTKGKSINCSDVTLIQFDENVIKKRLEKIQKRDIKSKLIIGTLAAVNVKFKGQQYVIKALGKLKKKGIVNFEYQLVGGGDPSFLKCIAEKYGVSNQVTFLGSIRHEDVFNWLDSIDIYIQPSRQEGLPRALIEAMSRGVPALGADTGGIPELLGGEVVFSNKKHNIGEICSILEEFNNEIMVKQAKRNYKEAKKYDKEFIEMRRKKFLEEFAISGGEKEIE